MFTLKTVTKEDYQQDIGINSDWKFPKTPFTCFWDELSSSAVSVNQLVKNLSTIHGIKEPMAVSLKVLQAERIKYHYKTVIL